MLDMRWFPELGIPNADREEGTEENGSEREKRGEKGREIQRNRPEKKRQREKEKGNFGQVRKKTRARV